MITEFQNEDKSKVIVVNDCFSYRTILCFLPSVQTSGPPGMMQSSFAKAGSGCTDGQQPLNVAQRPALFLYYRIISKKLTHKVAVLNTSELSDGLQHYQLYFCSN